jgi:hypothetical protein
LLNYIENEELRRIFGPKKEEEQDREKYMMKSLIICTLQTQLDELGGTYSTHGKMRTIYKVFVRKPEGKSPHRRLMSRFKDTIKINLKGEG